MTLMVVGVYQIGSSCTHAFVPMTAAALGPMVSDAVCILSLIHI